MPQSVRGIGAGGGIRTRGILLGGQALFQLSYARSGCPAQSLLKCSKPVAVRADDIALAGLNQHPIRAPADHPGDTADLGRRIPMVEVHGALRDSATAIETRHGSELIQQVCVVARMRAPLLHPARRVGSARRKPLTVKLPRSEPVAICTDDIALRRFGEQLRTTLQSGSSRQKVERLFPRNAMVEVHLMSGELTPAIGAGNLAKLPQECRGRGLSTPDALDFACPIARVVANVCRPLVTCFGHVLF